MEKYPLKSNSTEKKVVAKETIITYLGTKCSYYWNLWIALVIFHVHWELSTAQTEMHLCDNVLEVREVMRGIGGNRRCGRLPIIIFLHLFWKWICVHSIILIITCLIFRL